MPLYEYECQQCHRHTEKRQKFSDPEITECPHCGGHLQRVISAPNIAFKGGGWYKDLYSSPKPVASGENKSEAARESKVDGAPAESAAKPATTSGDASSSAASKAPAAPPASTSTPPVASTASSNKT